MVEEVVGNVTANPARGHRSLFSVLANEAVVPEDQA
jgi:hypothetical protein